MTDIIRNICLDIDHDIFESNEWKDVGSTAIFVLKFGSYIYVINIGDSRAVIFDSKNQLHLVTKFHKPTDEKEKQRIEAKGVTVWKGRVDGVIAVTRSFGDKGFDDLIKNPNSEPDELTDQSIYYGFDSVISAEPF
jgi:protein phosphatase PTC1